MACIYPRVLIYRCRCLHVAAIKLHSSSSSSSRLLLASLLFHSTPFTFSKTKAGLDIPDLIITTTPQISLALLPNHFPHSCSVHTHIFPDIHNLSTLTPHTLFHARALTALAQTHTRQSSPILGTLRIVGSKVESRRSTEGLRILQRFVSKVVTYSPGGKCA